MGDLEPNAGGQPPLTVEQRLQGVADFMIGHQMQAMLIDGALNDGRSYEGISFMRREGEVGQVL